MDLATWEQTLASLAHDDDVRRQLMHRQGSLWEWAQNSLQGRDTVLQLPECTEPACNLRGYAVGTVPEPDDVSLGVRPARVVYDTRQLLPKLTEAEARGLDDVRQLLAQALLDRIYEEVFLWGHSTPVRLPDTYHENLETCYNPTIGPMTWLFRTK